MDRLDIDALLIGSVYGELSSADETLLRAHLESHPADRTLLDRLTHARAVVQESRALAVQVEPPAQVSALLLQEAARRVPRKATDEERGWFAWLRRSIFMHPAMAAAAMLVVVVSVAGTVYMRQGDHVASPQVAAPAAPELASSELRDEAGANGYSAAAGSAPAAPAESTDGLTKRTGDQTYRVDLATEGAGRGQRAVTATPPKAEPKADAVAKPPAAVRERTSPNTILEVTTADRDRKPKELEDADAQALAPAPAPPPPPSPVTQAPRAPDAKDNRAESLKPPSRTSADPPPADAITRREVDDAEKKNRYAPSGAAKADAPSAVGGGAGGKGAPEPESVVVAPEADDAWSRDQHARLVAQVRARNCNGAAGTAAELEGRAPSYYKQNVATDRSVKECLAYINSARERAMDRSKAAKRSNDSAKDTAPAKAAPAQQQRSTPAPRK